MLNFPKLQLTNSGKLLIAASMKGLPFTFTKFQIGNGQSISPDEDKTALVSPVLSLNIESAVKSTGAVLLSTSFDNSELSTTLYASELGLFAQQSGGNEVLYAYAYEGTDPTPIPSYPTHGFMQESLHYTVAVGDAENFTVNIADALSKLRVATGSFTGDGTQGRVVSVGFTPRAVIVSPAWIDASHVGDVYGGTAVTGVNVITNSSDAAASRDSLLETWNNDYSALAVVTGGFKVNVQETAGIRTNELNRTYTFIAFK